jgi:transposase
MAGKSPVTASDEQRAGLMALADSRDRAEADRARAVLLTLAGWTSSKIAEAFGVREDTVRLWRRDFTAGGVAALKTSIAPRPSLVKSEAALRVVTRLLEEPVADRRNWTIPRLRAEIEAREGVRISRSQLSKACEKKFRWRRPRHTLKERQTESEVERVGLRLHPPDFVPDCTAPDGRPCPRPGSLQRSLPPMWLWASLEAGLRLSPVGLAFA